ncbi:hypothetical protein LSTR_LSTR009276 [Laodelphax striatellus]|uniref:Chromatin assembly factor 1 subunit A dimerization domain-containing protein n=1 Tax=Laodelphax striatellus TaxID=195883 RepID=A0A482X676_LAOST|nr:hypothetical protein LSTR_LSTR009276 [Laodelphax striatellus]
MKRMEDNESKERSPSEDTGSPPARRVEGGERKGGGGIATPASANKTPKGRKLTPTQLEKQKESAKKKAEREEKLLEKERLKKEKEEQANKLKEERLKMKQDKEEQKKREREEKEELRKKEKEEKEELRKKEKEEKEKKRLAEIEQKNEAKRQKEEEKKKQTEAREEERRRREEAKEEEKRKKDAEKRKAAEAFASFFKPKESNSAAAADEGNDIEMAVDRTAVEQLKFMPFEVKGDMRLSTVCRRTLDPATKSVLDEKMERQNVDVSNLYINLLKSKRHSPLSAEKTWPIADETEDDVIIIEAEVNEENGSEKSGKEVHKEKRTKRFKAKLLQFVENRRPPYWGTWRKKSNNIGARRPFNLDKTIFEYDVDSDDEWEEEEPGESLRGSDDENEKESEDEYEVDNKVFVPHGYLSDEEMQDDFEDCSREAQKAKLQLLEIEFQAEMTKKTEKLKPRLIGCVWFANSVSDPTSVGSRIAEMLLSRRMVLFDSEAELPIEARHRLSANQESSSPAAASSPLVEQAGRKSKFPESGDTWIVLSQERHPLGQLTYLDADGGHRGNIRASIGSSWSELLIPRTKKLSLILVAMHQVWIRIGIAETIQET